MGFNLAFKGLNRSIGEELICSHDKPINISFIHNLYFDMKRTAACLSFWQAMSFSFCIKLFNFKYILQLLDTLSLSLDCNKLTVVLNGSTVKQINLCHTFIES